MSFSQFIDILRARIWVFLATLLVTVGTTIVLSIALPPRYTAETTVVVDSKGMDPIFGVMMPFQLMPGYLATQVDVIQSRKVALEVVKALGIPQSADARAKWMDATDGKGTVEDYWADEFLRKLDVKPSRESSVISISFTWPDPKIAAGIANAFAAAYQRTNLELRVEPARQSAAWFDERLVKLRKDLESAQTRLNDYQRQKGFTAQDERLDLETSRLTEISSQYTSAQAQAADAESRLRQLNEYLQKGASPETIPDVLTNALIQNLKSQLTQTEAKLQQTASQLGANHPEVKRLEADIASQKTKLKSELAVAAAGVSNFAKIAQRREADLAAQMAAQKARLMKLNLGRDEMQVLMKEVENAQRAYDAAAQRSQQTNLESQASQTNISVLTKASPPIEASFPKMTLNIILAVFLGSMLGVGVALLIEMINRRVRSARDLADAAQAPVIGVMLDDRHAQRQKRQWGRGKVARPAVSTDNAVAAR